jgi:FKBP-type peptidyl-prolyl cis-trans isomerase 2/lipoprotein NlpI
MDQELRMAQKGDIVKINFTCTLKDGTIYDSSEGKEPLEFVIGEGEVFPSLEEAVIGMSKNESKKMQIQAKSLFGPYLKEKAQVIDRGQFPENVTPEVGLQFHIEQADGKTTVLTITDVTDEKVTLTPNHPLAGEDLFFDMQLVELEESNYAKAEDFFAQGNVVQDKGQLDEAIPLYQQAIKLNPKHSGAFYNLGVVFQKLGQIDKAIVYYEIAIGLTQNLIEAHHNLGIAYKDKGQFDEAIICFQRVLQLQPDHANAYYNLGNTLVAKGQFTEAMQCYRKAVEINPGHADAHWSIGLIHLRLGHFDDGWKAYEKRWELKDVMVKPRFEQPEWDDQRIDGLTILLYAEQGLGDTIQFVRYVPFVAERGAKVIVECQKELVSLLTNTAGVSQVVAKGEQYPDFDIHYPLLSLPLRFGTTAGTIPSKIPYINTNPALVQKWRSKIGSDNSPVKVGLVWAGNPKLKFGHSRSCSLGAFAPLADRDDVSFYSLQVGDASGQAKDAPAGMQLVDYTGEIKDFADTAAFIQNLDLIISVDTAAAHLAGALGKPVWTLLPFVADWRWMLEREDSPWYPTMRLFRQPAPADWESVIVRVKEALQKLVQ